VSDTYEGDIIRPLGLVTLYSGYAELEIDTLLESLSRFSELDDQMGRWPVGQKLAKARKIIDSLASDKLTELVQRLDEAVTLFDRRNALVHSAVFTGTSIVQSRVTGHEQVVTPDALTSLANEIFAVKEQINSNRQKVLEPILAATKLSVSDKG
jgi:hypothetical protein